MAWGGVCARKKNTRVEPLLRQENRKLVSGKKKGDDQPKKGGKAKGNPETGRVR